MNILSENISKKIVIITISIIIVVALSLSTTYSLIYNTKKLSKNTYTTGVLDIQYTEGEALELNNYIPMNDESGIITDPYTITITNIGSLTYKFDLSILSTVTDASNIIDAKYIRIQINENEIISLSELQNGKIYSNLILESNESMEINIKMWLSEDTPNTEIGHIYSAKLVATGLAVQNKDTTLHTTSKAYQTLVKLGLDKYAGINPENGIFETTNESEYLYYFKGDIDYNYILLNEKYYRIILIDSAGNMKLIYAGTKPHENNEDDTESKDTVIDEVSFNNAIDKKEYNGYTYLDENINEIDSTIKISLEKWYEENIKDTEIETEIVDTIYCNDKTETQDYIINNIETEENIEVQGNNIIDNNNIIYTSYNRLMEEQKIDLTCSPANSYTVSADIGNSSLKYPIGLITADELFLIGNNYFNHNIPFWTMTSAKFENNIAYNFVYNNKLDIAATDNKIGLKPVITIRVDDITGIGTKEAPFQITKEKNIQTSQMN